MKALLYRVATLWQRKQRARRLGFQFQRAAGFRFPTEIRIGSTAISLSLPDEGGSRTAFVDVLLDDCYQLWRVPDNISTVADIGCHAGLFAIAARERWPNAVIHGYEPNPALKEYWSYHATQAGFLVYPEAVGLTSGFVSLLSSRESVKVRSINATNGVLQVAFREVLARLGGRADVVKLDCEGAEWQILQDNASWENVRFLTMEFHLWAGYTLDELKSCVAQLGFRIRLCMITGQDFGILLAEKSAQTPTDEADLRS